MARRRVPPQRAFHARKQPRQRRSRATVDALVEATARLLAERGYRGATTRLVAERAGVSVGSLYQYFPSRDALVTAVLERHIDEVLDAVGALLRRLERAPLDRLVRQVVTRLLAIHDRDHRLHEILWEQLPRADRTAVFARIDRILSEHLRALAERRSDLAQPGRSIALLGRACLPLIHAREQGLDVAPERLVDDLTQLIVGYLGGGAPR